MTRDHFAIDEALKISPRERANARPLRHARRSRQRRASVPHGPADQQQQSADAAVVSKCEAGDAQISPGPMSWARLLKWVFDIDMQNCPNRGARELTVIANIPVPWQAHWSAEKLTAPNDS